MRIDSGVIDIMVQSHFGKEVIDLPIPKQLLRDEASRAAWPSLGVVQHMFGDSTEREVESSDPDRLMALFERVGISRGQVPVYPDMAPEDLDVIEARVPRLFGTLRVDPHKGYETVRMMDRIVRERPWIRSVSVMPGILYPPIPPNSKEFYPVFSKCIELNLPVMLNVGFPGPRVPGMVQHPMAIDEIAWFYPELTIVMKHGGQPWIAECIALLRKWPNVYYATTAYAPSRYPDEVLAHMRSSRNHRIVYGGYYPSISLDRIISELTAIDLPDAAADRFLRLNAETIFSLQKLPED